MPRKASIPQPLHAAQIADALLKLETVGTLCGLSIPTLYRRAKTDPTFPPLIRLGSRATRIRARDLKAWMDAQAEAC